MHILCQLEAQDSIQICKNAIEVQGQAQGTHIGNEAFQHGSWKAELSVAVLIDVK